MSDVHTHTLSTFLQFKWQHDKPGNELANKAEVVLE